MKLNAIFALPLMLGLSVVSMAQKAQDLYQQALVQERAVGDLGKAIELFQQAVNESGSDRELAAKALLGAARSYEKLGQANAVLLYEQLSRMYPDQTVHAAVARERLAELLRGSQAHVASSDVAAIVAQVRDLEKIYELNSRSYTPQHPEMVKLRNQLVELQRRIEQEVSNSPEAADKTALMELTRKVDAQVGAWRRLEASAEFDSSNKVAFTGTVKQVQFINPNVWIHVDVREPSGAITDHPIKGCSPSALIQAGWKQDTLKAGDVVTVEGIGAKDGSPVVSAATITLPDGRKMFAGWGTLPCVPQR